MSNAVTALWPMWVALAGKILTLVGATAQTIGVITFFALESLVPYRWPLIIGGTLVIIVSELAQQAFARYLARSVAEAGSDVGDRNDRAPGDRN
jgi:uncharacterized BrkB/YihY/UPF0761 family membrane protein